MAVSPLLSPKFQTSERPPKSLRVGGDPHTPHFFSSFSFSLSELSFCRRWYFSKGYWKHPQITPKNTHDLRAIPIFSGIPTSIRASRSTTRRCWAWRRATASSQAARRRRAMTILSRAPARAATSPGSRAAHPSAPTPPPRPAAPARSLQPPLAPAPTASGAAPLLARCLLREVSISAPHPASVTRAAGLQYGAMQFCRGVDIRCHAC